MQLDSGYDQNARTFGREHTRARERDDARPEWRALGATVIQGSAAPGAAQPFHHQRGELPRPVGVGGVRERRTVGGAEDEEAVAAALAEEYEVAGLPARQLPRP